MYRSMLLAGALLGMNVPEAMGAEGPIEEVVVTARKRVERIMDVPAAVQRFDGVELEQRGIRDVKELLSEIPGAALNQDAGPGVSTYHIRGSGVSGITGDAAIGYYVDDMPFSVPNSQLAPPARLFDLQSVEVLRGPQGTLWGQGSMGGLIRLVTTNPDLSSFGWKGEVSASNTKAGDVGYSADMALNLPIVPDVLGIRISGGYEKVAGFAEGPDFPNRDDINPIDHNNVRVKALWQPRDEIEVRMSYWTIESDQDFFNFTTILEPPTILDTGGVEGHVDSKADFYSLSLEVALDGATLVSSTAYMDYRASWLTGFGGFIPGVPLTVLNDYDVDGTLSQELRLVSDGPGALQWIVGAFYSDASSLKKTYLEAPPPFNAISSLADVDIESETYAVFGEISYELFGGKLVPLVGLRYFEDRRKGLETTLLRPDLPTESLVANRYEDTFKSLSPRFNLSYFPSDDAMVYVNIAEGFRSGTLQSTAAVEAALLDGIPSSPFIEDDSVWSYEIGGKWTGLNGSLTAEVAAYYNVFKDMQVLFGTSVGTFAVAQAGDAEVYGLELALAYRLPIDGLTAHFSGSVLDNEWTSVDEQIAEAVTLLGDGEQVAYVPKSNFHLRLEYERPVGWRDLDTVSTVSYSHRDDQRNFSDQASGTIDDLALRLGLRSDRWELYLFGENLLDDRGPSILVSPTIQYSYYPRKIGVTLKTSF